MAATACLYLPASGDQFGALTAVTTGLQPEKFTNKEVGAKWDINPLLTFTTAFFELDRENTPIRDTTRHCHRGRPFAGAGIEAGLAGYVTDKWQISAGYANLDARFVTDTSNAAGVVARQGRHPRAVRARPHLFAVEPL